VISVTWIVAVIGTFGVAGTIAAAIFFPAVVIPVLENLVTWLLRCKPCLFAMAIAGACFASWWFGHHQAVLQCREAELAAQLRNKQFDLERERQAKADAEQRAKEIEESANERAQKDADYISKLKDKPACLLDDDDIGGLPNDQPRPRFKIPSFLAK
jgi:hypothetical protein